MSKMILEKIDSPIGMMCARKYAKEIGKSENWVIERIKSLDIPIIPDDSKKPRYMIDIIRLNSLISSGELRLTVPRNKIS